MTGVYLIPTRTAQLVLQQAEAIDETRLKDLFSGVEQSYHCELNSRRRRGRANFSKGYIAAIRNVLAGDLNEIRLGGMLSVAEQYHTEFSDRHRRCDIIDFSGGYAQSIRDVLTIADHEHYLLRKPSQTFEKKLLEYAERLESGV